MSNPTPGYVVTSPVRQRDVTAEDYIASIEADAAALRRDREDLQARYPGDDVEGAE